MISSHSIRHYGNQRDLLISKRPVVGKVGLTDIIIASDCHKIISIESTATSAHSEKNCNGWKNFCSQSDFGIVGGLRGKPKKLCKTPLQEGSLDILRQRYNKS